MTARTSTQVKQAFKRFVELVKPIDDVHYVAAFDDEEPEISTYIKRLDEAVSFEVHGAEIRIMDEFPELPIDFHIWYLEGRPIESFLHGGAPHFYARRPEHSPESS